MDRLKGSGEGPISQQSRAIAQQAIEAAGGTLSSVYAYTRDADRYLTMGGSRPSTGEFFGDIKPACTVVEVSPFIKDDWLVETEADCYLDSTES